MTIILSSTTLPFEELQVQLQMQRFDS